MSVGAECAFDPHPTVGLEVVPLTEGYFLLWRDRQIERGVQAGFR